MRSRSRPRPPTYPFRSEAARAEYEAHYAERASAWPVPSETRVLDTPSGRTFVRVSGRPTDPPLVLLPGARVSSLMWIDTIATLSAGHRTYALDIIGDAGLSVSRAEISTPENFVTWLDEVLTILHPTDSFSMMGISLGGSIAAQYAARFPARVRGLVLLAPAATLHRFAPSFFIRFTILSLPVLAFGRSPLRRTCEWLFADALRGDAACRARAELAIVDLQRVVRVFALAPPPWPPVFSDRTWREWRVPCLILVGENEKIYSASAAVRRVRRAAPQVRAEIIAGAGHDLTLVKPECVTEKALAFLKECEIPGDTIEREMRA